MRKAPSTPSWRPYLLILCIFFIFPASGLARELQRAPLNPDFLAYRQQLRTAGKEGENLYGYAPPTVDLSHVKGPLFEKFKAAAAYPSTYDLRNVSGVNYVTPVRNQDPFDTSWAFGSLASLESTTLRNKQGLFAAVAPDYSEWHLAYFAYEDQDASRVAFTQRTVSPGDNVIFDQGGDIFNATAILARWTGAVNETDCPYWSTNKNPPASELPTGSEPNARRLSSVLFLGSINFQNDDIKYVLTQYGALTITYYHENTYWNPSSNSYYMDNKVQAEKGWNTVAIVGWNDSYGSGNFSISPPGDGAWIVKNSWGTAWGDNGYFHLSYYDENLKKPAVFLGTDTSTFDYIYQYDPLGWVQKIGMSNSDTAHFANVFTAGNGLSTSEFPCNTITEEVLKAVSFYAPAANASYEIRIYTGVTGDPATGTLAYGPQTGSLIAPGYYTIELDSELPLTDGAKFAVAVKLTTPGDNYPIPVENPLPESSQKATANAGESYIGLDGINWTDLTTITGYEETNVALKAFTGIYSGSPTPPAAGGGGCNALGFAPLGLLFLIPFFILKK